MPVAALFHPKAKKWVSGRRNILSRLAQAIGQNKNIIWVHCASLGEFEQGRPVIEKLRSEYPGHKILLTFFSPSGYEVRKEYGGADWIFYLPMDGPNTARRFLEIVNPCLVIFVKYEFWYYYLKKIKYRNIPLILVSALFWKEMSFFKWYGALQRKMLSRFDHLFVQDQQSKDLIDALGLSEITSVSGDTRFDRVVDIRTQATTLPAIEKFIGDSKTIIAGSTWPEDEELLKQTLMLTNHQYKLVIAPHEIHAKHLADLKERFPQALSYSTLGEVKDSNASVLIIDNIGLLSRLYQYAYISFIGGGFGKGIHNTLEAAVYGKPVVFGPVHHKFKEARDLLSNGGAIEVNTAEEFAALLAGFTSDVEEYEKSAKNAGAYVVANTGATEQIMSYLRRISF